MEKVDVVVAGAGVIGLSVARALAIAGREVLVVEAGSAIGTGTTSRNSGVIHAGIYHPRDFLKTRLCIAGGKALYAYCKERNIPHRRLGKLIAAAPGEANALQSLGALAKENGVDDLVWLNARQALDLEPELLCEAALLSPSTGIVDVHSLMLSFQGDLEQHGGMVAFNARVLGGRATGQGILLEVDAGERFTLSCRTFINCAGLGAQRLAAGIAGMSADAIPRLYLAKGNYFRLTGKAPFRHLVYPLPADGGAGIHMTLDLGGQARFGPDVEWIDTSPNVERIDGSSNVERIDGSSNVERIDGIDYHIDETRRTAFEAAIREYWPNLGDGAILPDYCGIRPKLHAAGSAMADFVIQDAGRHGVPGMINLFGIESPGLTSSLAIADYVALLIGDNDSRL